MFVAKQTAFGDRLKQLRESAGLSQYRLGQEAGVTPATISRIEAGLREPGWETVLRLARALNVSVAEFDTGEQFNAGAEPTPPEPSVDTSLEPTPLERESPSPDPEPPPPPAPRRKGKK
jgi:transcriptional regulator with XRE-family HTH domain